MEAANLNSMHHGPAKTRDEALRKHFEFWDTQPVPKLDEDVTVNEVIETDKPADELRKEPYSLPSDFHWETLDLNEPLVVSVVLVFFTYF